MPAGYYHVDASSDRIPLQIVRKELPLSPLEKAYILAVERGDYASVRQALEDAEIYFNININCVDALGRTALLISIQNENIEIIELLLKHNVNVGDALLHAIDEEVVEAVELLLNHKAPKKDIRARILQEAQETDFTSDITPVMLAAHRNNYEILKLLLERGASIPKPHNVRCGCDDCISSIKHDGLRHSRSRLNIYKALASPSLIALSSEDPILTAFELSWELRKLSHRENEFKLEYDKLVDQCKEFATLLLDQTRGSKELEMILNRDQSSSIGEEKLSRLRLAIKYKQKAFTAHPNCQQLLAEVWYRGLPGWRRQHWTIKIFISLFIGMSFPLLSIMYLVASKTKLGNISRLPFLKFICHSASYLLFLVLLLMASLDVGGSQSNRADERGPPPTDVECLIVVWVFGYVWAEIKQLWDEGLDGYLRDWWNLLDFIMNTLYITVIGLRVTAYVHLRILKTHEHGKAYLPRHEWDPMDPTLMSEAVFAVANIFSMLRLVYLFTANSHLGPLQISLGRMVEDIMKFLCIMILVIMSFGAGMNQLYWVYRTPGIREEPVEFNNGSEYIEPDVCFGVRCKDQNNAFTDFFETLQSLVWGIFGQVELHVVRVPGPHEITEFVGATMYGCYCSIVIVVLLNLLIAMMNNSYQKITDKADEEWKFARSKMWMSYFEDGSTLPVPFNLVPSPKSIFYFVRAIWRGTCGYTIRQNSETRANAKVETQLKRRRYDEEYQNVIRNLIKRYLKYKGRGERSEGVSEDDLNEIKQDISAFRYEMLELLKKFESRAGGFGGGGGGGGGGDGGGGGGGGGGNDGGGGGVGGGQTGTTTDKKTSNGIPNSMETSASVNSISSVGSTGSAQSQGKMTQSPSLERLPSYLLRKGKKKKGSKPPSDENYKPIKVAPTNDGLDDFSVPDFLKMKNIKNVVSAVNEMKRSTRRKLSGPIAEALLRKAAEMGENMPEEILEEDEEEYDTNDDTSSVDTRRQESVDSSIDGGAGYDSQDLGRDNMGLITEEDPTEERRSSLVSRNGSARAPLRREKAFAGIINSNDSKPDDDVTKDVEGDGAGGSQSSSGIASPNSNNSFQSQDSMEGQGKKTDKDDEDPLPDDDIDNGNSPSPQDSGHVPDGEGDMANMVKPGKRTSYLWGPKKDGEEGQDIEMTNRYVYNGFQTKDE